MAIEQCLKSDDNIVNYGSLSELGRSYTRGVTIKNECDHAIEVTGSFTEASEEGGSSAKEWLTFVGGESKFKMDANSAKSISLRAYLPEKTVAHSYYAQVQFKNDSSEQHDEEYGDVLKLSVRMDILDENSLISGNLKHNSAVPLSFGGKVAASAGIENTGTVGFVANYRLERSPAFGLEDYVVLAEQSAEVSKEASFSAKDFTENQYGLYKIRQTVEYVNNEGMRVDSILTQTVINLPWVSLFIAGGCLFALILLGIVMKAMKISRKEKKSKNGKKEVTAEDEEAEEVERLEKSANDEKEVEKSTKDKKRIVKEERAKAKAEAKLKKAEEKLKKAEEKAKKDKKSKKTRTR